MYQANPSKLTCTSNVWLEMAKLDCTVLTARPRPSQPVSTLDGNAMSICGWPGCDYRFITGVYSPCLGELMHLSLRSAGVSVISKIPWFGHVLVPCTSLPKLKCPHLTAHSGPTLHFSPHLGRMQIGGDERIKKLDLWSQAFARIPGGPCLSRLPWLIHGHDFNLQGRH